MQRALVARTHGFMPISVYAVARCVRRVVPATMRVSIFSITHDRCLHYRILIARIAVFPVPVVGQLPEKPAATHVMPGGCRETYSKLEI